MFLSITVEIGKMQNVHVSATFVYNNNSKRKKITTIFTDAPQFEMTIPHLHSDFERSKLSNFSNLLSRATLEKPFPYEL